MHDHVLKIEFLVFLPAAAAAVAEAVHQQVQDEGIEHEVEGCDRPVVMAIVEQVKEGDAVGCDVGERKN